MIYYRILTVDKKPIPFKNNDFFKSRVHHFFQFKNHVDLEFVLNNITLRLKLSINDYVDRSINEKVENKIKELVEMKQDNFIDSYHITLILKSDYGKQYTEIHNEMSLSDFEIMYGNITDEIISMNVSKIERNE